MSYAAMTDASSSPYDTLSPIEGAPVSLSPEHPSLQLSTADHKLNIPAATVSDSIHYFAMAHFDKQPPDNMRKSNFFNFEICLYDGNQSPIQIQKANFKDFYDTLEDGQEYRNGLVYKLNVVYRDGTQKEQELYVRLIDSTTKQLVLYEGTCKNPDLRRVLLTHELICSRCLEHRSCGNKNDTPSDPVITDGFRLKFFVKCNQNCLKNAGNPKDSRRRFQVAIYSAESLNRAPIASSESMFVHNNSKHGRRAPPFRETVVGDGKPYIITVYPSEGWTTGGSRICIVGMNFFEGIEVIFGTLPTTCEVLSPNAIAVRTPHSPRPGEVDITLVFKGSQFCINCPGKFVYLTPDDETFDNSFMRIERLLRNQDDPEDIPKDILLQRAADSLETFYSLPKTYQTPTLNHFGPMFNYPHSPFFALTPQPFQPKINAAILSPSKMNGSFLSTDQHNGFGHESKVKPPPHVSEDPSVNVGYPHSNPTSRTSSNETVAHKPQQMMNQPIFDFTNAVSSESMANGISSDPMQTLTGIHKPKPLTPGFHMAPIYPSSLPMSYVSMSQPHQHLNMPSHCVVHNSVPISGDNSTFMDVATSSGAGEGGMVDHSNRNNNGNHMMNNLAVNPVALIPRIMPPSPGYFMASGASPGLPVTPTGTGASAFNFCSPPLVSPGKPFRGSKVPKTSSTENSGPHLNYSHVFAALPSPQFGTFFFPPATPTGILAPLNLQDVPPGGGNSSETVTTVSSNTQQQIDQVLPRKRKLDGNTAMD